MSEPLPPELFGVPGTLNEWLSPEEEGPLLVKLDALDKALQWPADEDDCKAWISLTEDYRFLAQTCRKLLEARIATRNAVVKMSADLANYEQGQGILGAEQWTTERPAPGLYWICEPGKTNPTLAKVMKLQPDPDDSDDDGWTLEVMSGARWKLTRYLTLHPLRFSPVRKPQPPTP